MTWQRFKSCNGSVITVLYCIVLYFGQVMASLPTVTWLSCSHEQTKIVKTLHLCLGREPKLVWGWLKPRLMVVVQVMDCWLGILPLKRGDTTAEYSWTRLIADTNKRNGFCRHRHEHYTVQLQTKVPKDYVKISSQRRPLLLGSSPGWKCILAFSHLRHCAKQGK